MTYKSQTVEVPQTVLDTQGKVVTEDDTAVEELLNNLHTTFELTTAAPKSASDVLEAYGFSFEGAKESALDSEYSIPPFSVTNKTEFFGWLKTFFAQFLFDTEDLSEYLEEHVLEQDEDDVVDALIDAIGSVPGLAEKFSEFLSQESVFNFVSAVNGFYDNGGGKCYVYLMGTENLNISLRENQADKFGLYAFDDCEDIALMATPGLSPDHQKELLEHCEFAKTVLLFLMDQSLVMVLCLSCFSKRLWCSLCTMVQS